MIAVHMNASERFRLIIVGCGAVTRASLLPVLAGHDRVQVTALVDRDAERARELASAYGIRRVESSMEPFAAGSVDGVVIATPPAHHAPGTLQAVACGFHVFVEKPMATTAHEAEAMVAAAERAGVVLSVGLYRRLLPAARLLRGMVEAGVLGRPMAVDAEEGGAYTWPLSTLSGLTREGGGGGVLIDIGTHVLDQLLYAVPGDPRVVEYRDTSRGGIEADCELRLSLSSRWGEIPVRIELSRTRELRGTVRVACERGTLELARGDFCRVQVHTGPGQVPDTAKQVDRPVTTTVSWAGEADLSGYQAFRAEFDDWLGAIEGSRQPQLSGRSTVPVVRVIEEAYARQTPLVEPWSDEDAAVRAAGSAGSVVAGRKPTVLVT